MDMVIRLHDVLAHLGLCHGHGDKAAGCISTSRSVSWTW